MAICSPWGYVIGESDLAASCDIISESSRRSSLVPTRSVGVFGQWCDTCGRVAGGFGPATAACGGVRVERAPPGTTWRERSRRTRGR